MQDLRALIESRLSHISTGLLGSQGYVMGMDIGSYGLRAALVDLHNHSYTCIHADSDADHAEALFAGATELAKQLLAQEHVTSDRLVRIGVGFSGPVDARRGVVLLSHRMAGWEQFPLRERIESTFGAVTLVDNDANLIALAEASFGVGHDWQHLVYIHLSSGVGGGLVLDGRLFHGATTTAGEIGHAVVGPVDPVWGPERLGTLEQHVSVKGLMQRAAELGLETNLLSDIFGDHPVARQVVSEAVDMLAARLSQIVALLDPQAIVLGGVVTRSGGDAFLKAIEVRMRHYMASLVERQVPIVSSVLGFESVAIGGIALALESMRE